MNPSLESRGGHLVRASRRCETVPHRRGLPRREGSAVFYRNGVRLASRAGAGGWGRRLPAGPLVPAISIAKSTEQGQGRTFVAAPRVNAAEVATQSGRWLTPAYLAAQCLGDNRRDHS